MGSLFQRSKTKTKNGGSPNSLSRYLKDHLKFVKSGFISKCGCNVCLSGYKEVQVRLPEASGFCGPATGIYPSLARRESKSFPRNFCSKFRNTVNQWKFQASRNELRAGTSWLQLAFFGQTGKLNFFVPQFAKTKNCTFISEMQLLCQILFMWIYLSICFNSQRSLRQIQ